MQPEPAVARLFAARAVLDKPLHASVRTDLRLTD